jgi:hypothetical protein
MRLLPPLNLSVDQAQEGIGILEALVRSLA